MKILQVNKYYHPHIGGIETVVKDIHEVLVNENIQSDVLCIAEENKDTIESSRAGFDGVANTIYKQARTGVIFGMPISWSFLRKYKEIASQYDLIILHHPFPFGFFAYLLYSNNSPMVVWYHSDIVRQRVLGTLIRPMLKMVLARADRIVVSSQSIASNSSLLTSYKDKLLEIPFLANHSVTPKVIMEQTSNRPVRLLSVGRLVYYKGYEYLLSAMVGTHADLTIVGEGPLEQSLRAMMTHLKLTNVRIIPPVDDLSYLYEDCDIFILPSIEKSEAFGLVQLEAMSYGKPVINTALPTAVPSVSLHNETGLTVEPRNPKALQSAINQLIDDPDLRSRLGANAKQRTLVEFGYDRFRNNLKNMFEQILTTEDNKINE